MTESLACAPFENGATVHAAVILAYLALLGWFLKASKQAAPWRRCSSQKEFHGQKEDFHGQF